MLTHHKKILTVFAMTAVAAFGAGCARQGAVMPSSALKQPAAAKAPVAQPQIPPEAAKVPKPY